MAIRDSAAVQEPISEVVQSGWLIRQRPYRLFWLSRLVSQTAQSALLYGLLIVIVAYSERSIWSSLFVACSIVPSLLFGLVGGWVADRLPRLPLLLVLNVVRAGMVAVLAWQDLQLGVIFAVTLGIWTVHQFYSPAESALIPAYVPDDRLASGNAWHNFALNLAQIFGLVMIAPLLLKFGTPGVLFAVCAAGYAAAAVALVSLSRYRGQPAARTTQEPLVEPGRFLGGWRVLTSDRKAFAALTDLVLIGAGMSTLVVLIPHFLERVLRTSASNTVFVFAPAAIGLAVGLQLAPYLGRLTGFSLLSLVGLLLFISSIYALGFINQTTDWLRNSPLWISVLETRLGLQPRVVAAMMTAIPAGLGLSLVNVAARTVLLRRTPAETHARVFATQGVLANLGALVPTFVVGLLTDLLGAQPVAVLVASTMVAAAVLGRRIVGEESSQAEFNPTRV
jgi:MFS family permease